VVVHQIGQRHNMTKSVIQFHEMMPCLVPIVEQRLLRYL